MLSLKLARRYILIAMAIALALVAMDLTAVPLALPHIQYQLRISEIKMQWIVNAYLLAQCIMTIFSGKFGNKIGYRSLFILGVILFAIGSVSCAVSYTGVEVIFSRAIQGCGGGMIATVALAILSSVFPNYARGRILGYCIGLVSVFTTMGPVIGGFITDYSSWRWIFWLNLPLSCFCILLGLFFIPKRIGKLSGIKIDWVGFVMFATSVSALIVALMQGVEWGWSSKIILALFAYTTLMVICFLFYELNHKSPLVELKMLFQKGFSPSSIVMLLMKFAMIATVFWSIFLQIILNFNPAMAGILLLPVFVPALFMAPAAGYLRDRFGPRLPALLATLMVTLSAAWIGYTAKEQDYTLLFPAFLIFGCGFAMIAPVTMTTAVAVVAADDKASASSMVNLARQLGNILGVAILGAVITNVSRVILGQSLVTLAREKIHSVLQGTSNIKQAFESLTPNIATTIQQQGVHAYVQAFSVAMYVASVAALFAVFLSLFLPNKPIRLHKYDFHHSH